jgi:hypothetical protein
MSTSPDPSMTSFTKKKYRAIGLIRTRGSQKVPRIFWHRCLLHHTFVPPGQSVTGHYCVQVLQRLGNAVWRKWRDKWQGQWFLHHDNAPSHTSLVVQQFFAEKNIRVIAQPRDLAPTDFLAFTYSKKLASRGLVSQPSRTSNGMRRPNSGGFQKKPSASASNNGRNLEASVCT